MCPWVRGDQFRQCTIFLSNFLLPHPTIRHFFSIGLVQKGDFFNSKNVSSFFLITKYIFIKIMLMDVPMGGGDSEVII